MMQIFTLNQYLKIEVCLEMLLQMALCNLPAAFLMNIVSSISASKIICILIEPRNDQNAKLNE